jgi:hypothetical protein
MEKYACECGTVFYRYPARLTACPTCHQVVVDIDGKATTVFSDYISSEREDHR